MKAGTICGTLLAAAGYAAASRCKARSSTASLASVTSASESVSSSSSAAPTSSITSSVASGSVTLTSTASGSASETSSAPLDLSVTSSTSSSISQTSSATISAAQPTITNDIEGGDFNSLDDFTTIGNCNLVTPYGFSGPSDGGCADFIVSSVSKRSAAESGLYQVLHSMEPGTTYTVRLYYNVWLMTVADACQLVVSFDEGQVATTGLLPDVVSASTRGDNWVEFITSFTPPTSSGTTGVLAVLLECGTGTNAEVYIDNLFLSNKVTPANVDSVSVVFPHASTSASSTTSALSTSSAEAVTTSSTVSQVSSATSTTSSATSTASSTSDLQFLDWKTFKANGANLGSWLAKEKTHDPIWWASFGGDAADTLDEWSLCGALGDQCGPALEARYASFLNYTTIDALAAVGVNLLRIPTTYAAWVQVPGSQFYTGQQTTYLSNIANYAIENYGMHIVIDLHSLPGGVNNLDIGEGFMRDAWFESSSNLEYSLQAVSAVLEFIVNSGHMNSYTLAPINEASDNLSGFGTSAGLTSAGVEWVMQYLNSTIALVEAVDSRIPIMVQDSFQGVEFWAEKFDSAKNLVLDAHVYYFAAAGTYSEYVNPAVCGQAAFLGETTKFPVFVGEWALQVMYNNTYEARQTIFNTQRYAWENYVAGGSFWTAVSYSTAVVDGEGTQRDYWSYIDLINAGVIQAPTNVAYC